MLTYRAKTSTELLSGSSEREKTKPFSSLVTGQHVQELACGKSMTSLIRYKKARKKKKEKEVGGWRKRTATCQKSTYAGAGGRERGGAWVPIQLNDKAGFWSDIPTTNLA